jgi:hypothetical protein|tara:strand:- start:618 stop:1133 length:516 start_codon:yes stop_codon:yes gene_type:complete
MSQQFTIQSESIRDKLNSLLPSQNLGAIGVELTGSTQIVPIVDLTEVAEGSALRQDLQTSLSLTSVTSFNVSDTTTTLINTTGYFRVFGTAGDSSNVNSNRFSLTDGTTTKIIIDFGAGHSGGTALGVVPYDFIVLLQAGESLTATSSSFAFSIIGCTRQIADLSGNLINP